MQKANKTSSSDASQPKPELSPEDLAKLFNYPSIGELFSESDTQRLDEFCSRLASTRDNLERIVRHGNREDAARAMRAVRGIEVTLDFLQSLQKMRLNAQK